MVYLSKVSYNESESSNSYEAVRTEILNQSEHHQPHLALYFTSARLYTGMKRAYIYTKQTSGICMNLTAPVLYILDGRDITKLQQRAIAAVALSLGAPLEDSTDNTCESEGYIMNLATEDTNTAALKNRFFLSCCSLHSMFNALRYPLRECAINQHDTNQSSRLTQPELHEYSAFVPVGYTCDILLRTGHSVSCQAPSNMNICKTLFCKNSVSSEECLPHADAPLEGTKCGVNASCQFGTCTNQSYKVTHKKSQQCDLSTFCPSGYFFCPSQAPGTESCIRKGLACEQKYKNCLTAQARECCFWKDTSHCQKMVLSKFVTSNTFVEDETTTLRDISEEELRDVLLFGSLFGVTLTALVAVATFHIVKAAQRAQLHHKRSKVSSVVSNTSSLALPTRLTGEKACHTSIGQPCDPDQECLVTRDGPEDVERSCTSHQQTEGLNIYDSFQVQGRKYLTNWQVNPQITDVPLGASMQNGVNVNSITAYGSAVKTPQLGQENSGEKTNQFNQGVFADLKKGKVVGQLLPSVRLSVIPKVSSKITPAIAKDIEIKRRNSTQSQIAFEYWNQQLHGILDKVGSEKSPSQQPASSKNPAEKKITPIPCTQEEIKPVTNNMMYQELPTPNAITLQRHNATTSYMLNEEINLKVDPNEADDDSASECSSISFTESDHLKVNDVITTTKA